MICAGCKTENPREKKFCRACGVKLVLVCSGCGAESTPSDKFCGDCGHRLVQGVISETDDVPVEGERKYVTVLFTDLSGYSKICEKLDPEETKEIMGRIFGETAQVVTKYEGFIEKFVGDAVMALFGVPEAHEDDPVRAIKAAAEIHELVSEMSPGLEDRLGMPLAMHTGINTGLVVTGQVDLKEGSHGVSGETINKTSQLCRLAKPGEILIGPDTYVRSSGYFYCEEQQPTVARGEAEPFKIYKVLSKQEEPAKVLRAHGLKADLIARNVEMAQLAEAVDRLKQGRGTIFSITGAAGTGKSRLTEEFKATLDFSEIQWREGHAYAYSQNMPYAPLIDLFNRAWQIEEGDPPETVKEKIGAGLELTLGNSGDVLPYVSDLYSLSDPRVDEVSPEQWKSRLHGAVLSIFSALAAKAPTVICLEDLHWADPSSLDLLRFILMESKHPAIFLCVYRPPLSLFSGHQLNTLGKEHKEIQLHDLSQSETQDMVESLLKADEVPSELLRFIRERVEGNPFYLEEVINSLVESEILIRKNGEWRLTRPISEVDIPSTIHGILAARFDRLENETKRILQEASVIGRVFLDEVLKSVTGLGDSIDHCLTSLERLDLIKTRSYDPDLEYIFKHALTQEVAYSSLLHSDRQSIHERIALVIEDLFNDRLPEFYETLAFHFGQGNSTHKAIEYLAKSGEKSLARYAVKEAHQYYRDAFWILADRPDKSREDEELLVDLLIKWSFVYYYRGNYKELLDLLSQYKSLAESLADRRRLGMYYAWLGCALWHREMFDDAYQYLTIALQLGAKIEDGKVVGYACSWLTWTCTELGLMDEAVTHAVKAQGICQEGRGDHYIYFNSLAGMGYAFWHKGERRKTLETGQTLVDFGNINSNNRSMVLGYCCQGWSYLIAGDLPAATSCFEQAVNVSADPWYSLFPKLALCYGYISYGEVDSAEQQIEEILDLCLDRGAEFVESPTRFFQAITLIARGQLNKGIKILEDILKIWRENDSKLRYVSCGYILAKVYGSIAQSDKRMRLLDMLRNLGFVVTKAPFASQIAANYYGENIEEAKAIGADGVLGRAYLDLGLLHKAKKRTEQARDCLSKAIQLFEKCDAEVYLKEAKEALLALG